MEILWCTDITEHPTATGKVYCCAVFSRVIVGWSTAHHMRPELVVDALQMATWRRRPEPGGIVHGDRARNTPRGSSATGSAKPDCSAPWGASPRAWTTR